MPAYSQTESVLNLMQAPQSPTHSQQSRSFFARSMHHLWHDRLTMLGIGILLTLTLACFLGPVVVENVLGLDVNRTNVLNAYAPLGAEGHLLGTDQAGRDHFLRLLYGGRISLAIAYVASALSITVGLALGLIAGYYGGLVDDLIIWVITTLNSIPAIFLLIVLSTIWSPSPEVLVFLLAFFGWIGTCRLIRGEVLTLKQREYVVATRALGARDWQIMVRHIFPNLLSVVITALSVSAGSLILAETGLSFLGLGVQPPDPTWGNMLSDARTYFKRGVHLVTLPGLLITVTVFAFYVVGDGVRDAFDPRTRGS
ncbi:MAG: hypothetical protein OHK0046_45730 [Anaerolineae bacterium]